MERRRVLVARVVRRALGALCNVQDARELLRHLKVRVRVEVPVGAERCLNLLVPKALLKEQRAFAHVDEERRVGMP